MGFMHATPGDMKSFRSSAERMALIVSRTWWGRGGGELGYGMRSDQTMCKKQKIIYTSRTLSDNEKRRVQSKSLSRCAEKAQKLFDSHACNAPTYR
jgi:hypothetical protein